MDNRTESFAIAGLAAIELSGPETDVFLQGQLTADIDELKAGSWTWAGYCTPRGKMLCTGLVWRSGPDAIGMLMDADLAAGIVKRLQMYVLRAKTKPASLPGFAAGSMNSSLAANCAVEAEDGWIFGLGEGRELLWKSSQASVAQESERQWWLDWLKTGAPLLSAATAEQLTPQMASLDLAGGVSFTKGCYVGQEIIARTHYRGAVKRRAYVIAGSGTPPEPGTDLMLGDMRNQAGGTVIRSAMHDDGFIGLASLRVNAVDGQVSLHDGRQITVSAPPYGA